MNEDLQPFDTAFENVKNRPFQLIRVKKQELVCELLSALCTATCENLAAVLCCHSFTEAVFHLSVALFGLVSSFHCVNLLLI